LAPRKIPARYPRLLHDYCRLKVLLEYIEKSNTVSRPAVMKESPSNFPPLFLDSVARSAGSRVTALLATDPANLIRLSTMDKMCSNQY
jgi:hypothetical protein